MPPSHVYMTDWQFMRSGGLSLSKTVSKNVINLIDTYSKYAKTFHGKYAPGKHWYLYAIAVRKRYQGKGIAGALIKPMLAMLDERKLPCFLETQNGANVPKYEHYGFKTVETGILPNSEIMHWAMLRTPGA